ncbi:MAG: ABC transporter permease, partial [Spirochaetales bacterium]|nr:ABC transporter permease [Spirochaetales bacterium]
YIHDDTGVLEGFIQRTIGLEKMEEENGEFFVDSREALIEGMREDKAALGLIVTGPDDGTYKVEFLTQPYTTEAMITFVDMEMEDLFSLVTPPYNHYPPEVLNSVRVTALQWGLRDEIPFNQRLLPAVVMLMVGIIGLFIMISLIGQERIEGTVRAYRVTPASLRQFLASKHLLLLALGCVTFSIMYLPIMGIDGYLQALLIILLTIIFGSSLGVILGSIFDSPMSSILWVLLLMIVLSLPAVSLFAPAFSPAWLKAIPSYHTLFGLDAAMFPDGNGTIIWQSAGILAGLDVVLLFLSNRLFTRLITREV